MTENGLIVDSIDALEKLEKTYSPIKSNSFYFEKELPLSENIKKEKNYDSVNIVNLYNILLEDSQTTIDTQEVLDRILSRNYAGSSIKFHNPSLQNELDMNIHLANLKVKLENDGEKIKNGERSVTIYLPYINTDSYTGEKNPHRLAEKLADNFYSRVKEDVEDYMRENYSQIVTTQEEKVFTGGHIFTIKSILPFSLPSFGISKISDRLDDSKNIELVDKKWAENAWKRIDSEMREIEIEKINKENKEAISNILEKQKKDKEFYLKNATEVIDGRYAIYKKEDKDTKPTTYRFISGQEKKIITYFDLKTGAILYQEEKEAKYWEGGGSRTLGGDGWRRGMVVTSKPKQESSHTEKYTICDNSFENPSFEDRKVFEEQKNSIIKNIESMKNGGASDEKFMSMIEEIENRCEEEKELYKKYLGE